MKKWCVAAAMAAVSGAWAQSSVTLSGVVDLYAGSIRMAGDNSGRRAVLDSGGMTTSYYELSGVEDLGGGLAVGFRLGSFLRADEGAVGRFPGDSGFARDANVYARGGWGTLTLGRGLAPNFLPTILFNPLGDSFAFSPLVLHANLPTAAWPYASSVSDTGWSNQISYSTPSIDGLTANVRYQFGEQSTSGQRGKSNVGVDALYFNGPLALGAFYERGQISNPGAGGLLPEERRNWMIGGSYDFSAAKLFLSYGQSRWKDTRTRLRTAQVGVSVPVGSGAILASVAHSRASLAPPDDSIQRTTATLGYDHRLSKRTDVYVNLMHDRVTRQASGRSFGAGIRHRF